MNNLQKILCAITGTLSTLCIFIENAQAQIQISPLVIEREAKQGKSQGVINITNTSNETFRARVYTLPFTYNKDGFEELKSSPQDLSPYLTFSPRELVLEPGQTRQIRATSRFLPSSPKGEYRAVIFTEDLKEIKTTNGNRTIGLTPRLGVTFYVRYGDVSPNLKVESATYNPQTKKIVLQVQNSGNATARPKINWNLKNSEIKVADGRTDAYTVIFGGARNLQIDLSANEKQIAAGNYKLSGELTWREGDKDKNLPFNVDVNISDKVVATDNKKASQQNRLKMLLKSN
ncbi:MAG: P pilus assembly protein, chaperone PapD [Richelia sp. RM2_1_2]|nr:P pilus assembly protein, chaperone PapD [Richelia sp. SM1_7_0]NJN10568.1 P pilus assembly protein, chaperone PapD [Richelia sp. RM1_1_1]NJO64760.1 P pilus assembly protein, chaperone PapD [Richelia sp. RM2_1_2]